MLMDLSVRNLHTDMIKPAYNGGFSSVVDSVTHIVLISDTTLRSFVSPQVLKMTPKLHQICGCKIFVIPKDMHINLNRLRTILVTDLHHESVGRYKSNSIFSTTSAAQYKWICFR